MKLIVALIFFCLILYFGWISYHKTRKKAVFYNDFLQFSEIMETEIGFFQNKIDSILKKGNYKKEFLELVEEFAKNKNLDNWKKEQNLLTDGEAEEIINFFNKLGKADSITQTKEIQNYKKLIEEKRKNIKDVQLKNAKLMFSLSIMLGLLVFVIII